MKKPKTIVISVRLPEETVTLIDALARIERRSRSYIINEAIKLYLEEGIAYGLFVLEPHFPIDH